MTGVARLAAAISLFILLAACGSDNGNDGSIITPEPTPEPEPVFTIGSGSGSSFEAGTLSISVTDLSGGEAATINASIVDENGNLFTGQAEVTFRSDCSANDQASIESPVAVVDGFVSATYQPEGCVGSDNITATVTINGETSSATGALSVRQLALLGTDPGTGFVPGELTLGMSSIAAGGITSVSASVADGDGNAIDATAESVTFTSTCTMNGLAEIDSPIAIEGSFAETTYTAKGCSGDDTITANVTIDGARTTASAIITVQPPVIGSIQFVSAEPETIGIRGFGLNEVSRVTFVVLDTNGNPVRNEVVNFSLTTDIGGLSVTNPSASSNADGQVFVDVRSGFIHTSVAVAAELESNPALGTQSSKLVVTTGIADQDSMTVGATILNPEGWNINGVESEIVIQAADHFNNPVPDGTAVALTTEGGQVTGQCLIVDGGCTAIWRSANPRPVGGRVTVLATLIGEESFTDTNGNGVLDAGDPFIDSPSEAFRDDTENAEFDQGIEEFLDFNNNGEFDGADGAYNGVLCCDADAVGNSVDGDACFGLTPTETVCSANRNIHVRGEVVLVMTASAMTIEADNTSFNGAGESADGALITIWAITEDGTLQYPSFGTLIEVDAGNGELVSASSYEIGSTNITAPFQFFLNWKGDDKSSAGTVAITATTESGAKSSLAISAQD